MMGEFVIAVVDIIAAAKQQILYCSIPRMGKDLRPIFKKDTLAGCALIFQASLLIQGSGPLHGSFSGEGPVRFKW